MNASFNSESNIRRYVYLHCIKYHPTWSSQPSSCWGCLRTELSEGNANQSLRTAPLLSKDCRPGGGSGAVLLIGIRVLEPEDESVSEDAADDLWCSFSRRANLPLLALGPKNKKEGTPSIGYWTVLITSCIMRRRHVKEKQEIRKDRVREREYTFWYVSVMARGVMEH
jgi:hypothetical protein